MPYLAQKNARSNRGGGGPRTFNNVYPYTGNIVHGRFLSTTTSSTTPTSREKKIVFDWVQLGNDITNDAENQHGSMNSTGNIISFGAPDTLILGTAPLGGVYYLEFNGVDWIIRPGVFPGVAGGEGIMTAAFGMNNDDDLGYNSLNSTGDIIAVAAPLHNNNKGYIEIRTIDENHVFSKFPNNQNNFRIKSTVENDFFGTQVQLNSSGTTFASLINQVTVATGAAGGFATQTFNSVKVYDLDLVNQQWVDRALLTPSIEDNNIFEIESFSLNSTGNIVAVGGNKPTAGGTIQVVRVYFWMGAWVQKGLEIELAENSAHSISLSNDGNVLAVFTGLGGGGGLKAASVFDWNGATWVPRGTDIVGYPFDANVGFTKDRIKISGNGNVLVIYDHAVLRAKVFRWNGAAWEQLGTEFISFDQLSQTTGLLAVGVGVNVFTPNDVVINDTGSVISFTGKLEAFGNVITGMTKVFNYQQVS